jgi:hypothetical protein
MKSGFKTTEFWLTLVGSVVAVVVALQVLTPEEGQAVTSATGEVIKAVAGLIAILAPIIGPVFYNHGRAKVKAANGKK